MPHAPSPSGLHGRARFGWLRAGLCGLALCLGAPPRMAHAHSPEAAAAAFADEDDATAVRWLTAWLDGPRADIEGLPLAARLARELKAGPLLLTARSLGEEWQAERGGSVNVEAQQRAALALGWAYLGLAEHRIETGASGTSITLLLADVEACAERLAPGPERSVLLASKRATEGNLDGAIAGLAADRAEHGARAGPALLEGRLRYQRAAAWPAQADGRPTPEAAAELGLARDLLGAALDDLHGGPLGRARREGHLTRAWAAHRLGDAETASGEYLEAWRPGTRAAPLVLRGLASLHAHGPATLVALLEELRARTPEDPELLAALARAQVAAGAGADALATARERLARDPAAAAGWLLLLEVARALGEVPTAMEAARAALARAPGDAEVGRAVEALAQARLAEAPGEAVALYEALVAHRPDDPFVRNNLGFVLRELVTPHTEMLEGARQVLRDDAPPEARAWLARCVAVYLEAVARIPEEDDGRRPPEEDWNLAGIVNDAGLMLHYFVDAADPLRAEALYLRALRMTEYGHADAYLPNLRRLYGQVLPGREWTWMQVARRARDGLLAERRAPDGTLELVPDEAKRAVAARDAAELRGRILEALREQAAEEDLPWPPPPAEAPARR